MLNRSVGEEIMVGLDRAATKLLAFASTLGVVGAVAIAGAGSAGASTGGAGASALAGPSQQAVVALAGNSAVSVPGIHVQTVLGTVHVELVDGSAAALAALAAAPGVLGVEPNAKAHLQSQSFGDSSTSDSSIASSTAVPVPWPIDAPSSTPSASPSPSPSDSQSSTPDVGVIAPTTLGGKAGKSDAGSGVTIALIDTGVSDTDALNRASGRLVDAVDTSGLNTDTGSVDETGVFSDGYGHGTFMASLIAGGKVAGSGNVGVGVAPGATVDVVKVADDQGNTSLAAVLAGLNWVATHSDSVDVANLSLSVDRPLASYGIDPLNYAVTLTRNAGVTVVVAAGNTAGVVGDPGFGPASLTVGSADTTGDSPTVAPFSGYANVDGVQKPDVVASGVNILGEMPADSVIGQTFPAARQPSGLFRGSGTSQSTAIVSGLAAIYLQAHSWANPAQVKSAIRQAASSIDSGPTDGRGLVSIPTGNPSPFLTPFNTGEQSLNVAQWTSTASQWGDLFTGGVFDARRWSARRWNADGWTARRWAGVDFDARRWAARRWAGANFEARRWDARLWAASSWGAAS